MPAGKPIGADVIVYTAGSTALLTIVKIYRFAGFKAGLVQVVVGPEEEILLTSIGVAAVGQSVSVQLQK